MTGSFLGYSAAKPRPVSDPVGHWASPWRTQHGADLPSSAAFVSTLMSGISGPERIDPAGPWSHPTFYAEDTHPQVKLRFSAPSWPSAHFAEGFTVRVPPGMKPPPGGGGYTDAHIELVLSLADCIKYAMPYGTSLQFWKWIWVSSSEATYKSGNYGNIAGSLVGGLADSMGADLCAGQIRAQEIAALSIPHALFFATHKANIRNTHVWPALGGDGEGTSSSTFPTGTRFRLAYTPAEIQALPQPSKPAKAILEAAAKYGLICGDGSGSPFELQFESSVMYTSQGQPNRVAEALALYGVNGPLDVTSGVDWKGRLRACS